MHTGGSVGYVVTRAIVAASLAMLIPTCSSSSDVPSASNDASVPVDGTAGDGPATTEDGSPSGPDSATDSPTDATMDSAADAASESAVPDSARDSTSDSSDDASSADASDAGDACGVCCDGDTRPCYTGPNGTAGVGACTSGTQVCSGGAWPGSCPGEVTPTAENCCDTLDHNCDGRPGCRDVSCTTNACCLADASGD